MPAKRTRECGSDERGICIHEAPRQPLSYQLYLTPPVTVLSVSLVAKTPS
jgi:hypothetical protein